VPNSPGAGRKLQPGPGCGCHGYTATTLRAAVLLRRMSLLPIRMQEELPVITEQMALPIHTRLLAMKPRDI